VRRRLQTKVPKFGKSQKLDPGDVNNRALLDLFYVYIDQSQKRAWEKIFRTVSLLRGSLADAWEKTSGDRGRRQEETYIPSEFNISKPAWVSHPGRGGETQGRQNLLGNFLKGGGPKDRFFGFAHDSGRPEKASGGELKRRCGPWAHEG